MLKVELKRILSASKLAKHIPPLQASCENSHIILFYDDKII
jgi:hypothetical protein